MPNINQMIIVIKDISSIFHFTIYGYLENAFYELLKIRQYKN